MGRIVLASVPQLVFAEDCGANSSGVCSPVGVRQLLDDAVPCSDYCVGLSDVSFEREDAF